MKTRLHVLILQHPQEPGETLGTARLTTDALENSVLRTGLSWPNLRSAMGKDHPLAENLRSQEWGVLYLGTGLGKSEKGTRRPRPRQSAMSGAGGWHPLDEDFKKSGQEAQAPESLDRLVVLKDGRTPTAKAYSSEREEEIIRELKGIVILDGTWKQAKTLWWRNAWLLKLRRIVLLPERPSLYGRLRREPRRECLSTIESVGIALEKLGESAEVRRDLFARFDEMLRNRKSAKPAADPADASDPPNPSTSSEDSPSGE